MGEREACEGKGVGCSEGIGQRGHGMKHEEAWIEIVRDMD